MRHKEGGRKGEGVPGEESEDYWQHGGHVDSVYLNDAIRILLFSQAQEDDKWGPWGEWSPCSRTCGVGVSYQERECLEKEK